MLCEKCGKELEANSLFCDKCGARVFQEAENNYYTNSAPQPVQPMPPPMQPTYQPNILKEPPSHKPIIPLIVGLLAIIVVCFLAINGKLPFGNRYVSMVKNGHPTGYPNRTYGDAFNNFFSNPKWKYLKSTNGLDIVQFDGDCTYLDGPAHMVIQFDVNVSKGTFEIYAMEIDGTPQNKFLISVFMIKIFES
ncbi:MAG TPA: hypothetical protein DCG28_04105 [Lachnospiraceae bacterium]|nr:hypothetical protein [Lachnospiraceae bacterium]